MSFTPEFLYAFHHSMLYEVGPWWDPKDPEVISGACETREQRRKVGYVNIKEDRGGVTKYGVAQNANPEVDVHSIDLKKAMDIYFQKYWLAGRCNHIPYPVQIMHFDACINHGVGRAARMLQQAVGAVPDGIIGRVTLDKIAAMDTRDLIVALNDIRVDRFNRIVASDKSQERFLRGWLRRASEVFHYTLSHLPDVR